jgi:hypothetical protein
LMIDTTIYYNISEMRLYNMKVDECLGVELINPTNM